MSDSEACLPVLNQFCYYYKVLQDFVELACAMALQEAFLPSSRLNFGTEVLAVSSAHNT